jgi:aspartate--ammonia ligase
MYPDKTGKEREHAICKKHKAVFLIGIGDKLESGEPHDGRAADYDDWHLNGDLLLYYEELDIEFEISSMGIRVDEESILKQLKEKNEEYKLNNEYVQGILNKKLPYTIGGGIGQSRICMFYLRKAHIGEVHASLWPEEIRESAAEHGVRLL